MTELRVERRELREGCKDFIVCNYEACSDNGARLQPNIVRLSPIPVSPDTVLPHHLRHTLHCPLSSNEIYGEACHSILSR